MLIKSTQRKKTALSFLIRPDLSGGDRIRYEWRWEDEDTGSVVYHDRYGMDHRSNTGGGERMVEIKEEFCEVMTLASAYIYHKDLNIDFVMGNGEVSQLWINGTLEWDKEKCP